MTSSTKGRRPTVFISFSNQDRERAEDLIERLDERDVQVSIIPIELNPESWWKSFLRDSVSAKSYFVFLVSRNITGSRWPASEADHIISEFRDRDITIVPVLLDKCEIPRALASYQWFDMRGGLQDSLDRLAGALRSTPQIAFDCLSHQEFEKLVAELLERLGFESIRPQSISSEQRADFIAEYRRQDPFEGEVKETYVIETKLYRHSRPDLRSIHQLIELAHQTTGVTNAVLITNSQLTSVAMDWVIEAQAKIGIQVRIIDGTELKRLLLQHSDLVNKYFSAADSEK